MKCRRTGQSPSGLAVGRPRKVELVFGPGLGLVLGLTACRPPLPAPLSPTAPGSESAADEEAQPEADRSALAPDLELSAGATRVGPDWLPSPLTPITPQLGEGVAKVLTPRLRVGESDDAGEAEVVAELVAVGLEGEKPWLSVDYRLDAQACDFDVELNELEGLAVAGHYMFQLTCNGGGDTVFVDSYTMLVRLDMESERAVVLWEGEGASTNERDACLEYDVVNFLASKDGREVLAVRERETLRVSDEEDAMELPCELREFEQLPAARIDLSASPDEAVTVIEVPDLETPPA